MKFYYCPGACSLAGHIALFEAGVVFESESVDLKRKVTAGGVDFNTITSKGYVPAIVLDDGEVLTENIAVLDFLAQQYPQLGIGDGLSRTRLLEALAYISTEIHKSFKPFWRGGSDADKAAAAEYIVKRMSYFADSLQTEYLFGDSPSVADFYLFVTMMWAEKFGIAAPAQLLALYERLKARPAVQRTLEAEGLR
ncbi:glutathione S-transferase [Sphingomonas panacis]|uniref:Glutathione S-transferase n=1 Tax=Sphingomonas panacis TaxID=1560345 RepID=A0A1B3ZG40_9SPHN|nr:glutathione S-transferase family protein [Sphingomonas panacis]AOH86392.1 glutathione S-transferase [Sphingomonas panacis]